MNDIYIDANVSNSFFKTDDNSQYTYKLSEPLELPKGTNISIQQSFINKKGITGGSMEITEDIYEVVEYIYYITEQGHQQPLGAIEGVLKDWQRTCLSTEPSAFLANWDVPQLGEHLQGYQANVVNTSANAWCDESSRVLYGEEFLDDTAAAAHGVSYWREEVSGNNSGQCFTAYGGNNMVLPHCRYKLRPGTAAGTAEWYMTPVVKQLEIFIPKGVYGISQLGGMIQDYFNGEISVVLESGKRVIQRKSNFQKSLTEDEIDFSDPYQNRNNLDGQPYNSPAMDWLFTRQDRMYYHSDGSPADGSVNGPVYKGSGDVGMEGFTSMDCFNELLAFSQTYGMPNTASQLTPQPDDKFNWKKHRGTEGTGGYWKDTDQNPVRPFYWMTCPENETKLGTKGKEDSDDSLLNYNIHGYAAKSYADRTRTKNDIFKQLIGTSNFEFTYNTEKNGYEIKGLHQVMYGASHSSTGVPNPSSGKQIINLKRVNEEALHQITTSTTFDSMYEHYVDINTNPITTNSGYFGTEGASTNIQQANRMRIMAQLNSPESRMGGMMILNWAKEHSRKTGDTVSPDTTNIGRRFDQNYSTEKAARKEWENTLWFKLGFTYDQLANRAKYKKQRIYNKSYDNFFAGNPAYFGGVDGDLDCGFTTDAQVDNSIVSSVSTLNCPVEIKADSPIPARTNFQIYGYGSTAIPSVPLASKKATIPVINEYSNSLYRGCATIPVAIADVGGITAENLPTLSQESYYLITSDICDNFKDNVKKGDPIALLGVVAKSNLSNQDFIVDKNSITQVISQDKVINSIKIKILNPDLTAPKLDRFSSILLKIQRPNITPSSLLQPKQLKMIEQETATN